MPETYNAHVLAWLEWRMERFADAVAHGAIVVARQETFDAIQRDLPQLWRAMTELAARSGGKLIPNRWCAEGQMFAVPVRTPEVAFPRFVDPEPSYWSTWSRFQFVRPFRFFNTGI